MASFRQFTCRTKCRKIAEAVDECVWNTIRDVEMENRNRAENAERESPHLKSLARFDDGSDNHSNSSHNISNCLEGPGFVPVESAADSSSPANVELDWTDIDEQAFEKAVSDLHQIKIYGENQLVYNIHCFTHLMEDVRKYGPLDKVSAFPFENYLGKLKSMVRKPDNPLAQIVNRLSEQNNLETLSNLQERNFAVCRKIHNDGPVPLGLLKNEQYKQYQHEGIYLSCTFGDNCVEIGEQIGVVRNILRSIDDNACSIVFSQFEVKEPLLTKPLQSDLLDIFHLPRMSECCSVHRCEDISRKYMLIPLPGQASYAAFPLNN